MRAVQILADGTRITEPEQPQGMKFYRDTLGRTRVERSVGGPPRVDGSPALRQIEINDPAAGVLLILWETTKVAYRVKYAPVVASPLAKPEPPPYAGMPSRPDVKRESIGTRTISGVLAEGTLMTATYATGSVGNDRPFKVESEEWRAPSLQLTLRRVARDPRRGEDTFEMVNFSAVNPDSRLFEAPAGYEVVDRTIPFRLEYRMEYGK